MQAFSNERLPESYARLPYKQESALPGSAYTRGGNGNCVEHKPLCFTGEALPSEGRLAQRSERSAYTREVPSSNLGLPTTCATIPLTKGYAALVDFADFERVNAYRWHASVRTRVVYAMARVGGQKVYLHRFILNLGKGEIADHVDRDGLNCVRRNLRRCTASQNLCNTRSLRVRSISFRGVYLKGEKSYRALISVSRRIVFLGTFSSQVEAAIAYDNAARHFHGEFAVTNFPATDGAA
jgi:hypothetical protein